MKRYTIRDFNADFADDEACLRHVASMVYPSLADDGTIPCRSKKCGGELTKHYRLHARKAYTCEKCGTHVYPLAGTIFEKSSTPLKSWFYAMYLMSTTRSGISAKQLERELGVTYKTAWRMFKQIRTLLDDNDGPLSGTVEIDETWVGGKPRYLQPRRGRRLASDPTAQTPVVGMVERDGSIKAWATKDVKTKTIKPLVLDNVVQGTTVYTDTAWQYGLVMKSGYEHSRINHTAKVYVDGIVHTNTIEGFWMLLKNGIRGVYHSVGKDYLQTYVDEYTFRYNHRKDETPMFQTIKSRVTKVRSGKQGAYAPVG